MVSTSLSSCITDISTIKSSASILIDLTPLAVLPIALTVFSWKRIHLPFEDAISNSLSPKVSRAEMSSSPSSKDIAILPFLRMLSNSLSLVFFILPLRVASTRLPLRSCSSVIGSITVTRSPCSTFKRLLTVRPRAILLASGIS